MPHARSIQAEGFDLTCIGAVPFPKPGLTSNITFYKLADPI